MVEHVPLRAHLFAEQAPQNVHDLTRSHLYTFLITSALLGGRCLRFPMVIFKEEHISFFHFLTNICAIVGGIFATAGIFDALVYHGHRVIKKMEMGKLS